MSTLPSRPLPSAAATDASHRLDSLDAARAFALVLGVFFHGALSFSPMYLGWAVQDVSTCAWVPSFLLVSHAFRMGLFFFLAGYFSQRRLARGGDGEFLRGRLLQLGIPLVAGWFLLRLLLVSGWVMGAASLRGDVDIGAGLREGFASLKAFPAGFLTGTHLWFLYYLLLVTGLLLGVRACVRLVAPADAARGGMTLGRAWLDRGTARLAHSSLALPVLVVPTGLALGAMQGWGMDTPDRSLWPQGPVLAIYGLFFFVGAGFGRDGKHLEQFVRVTPRRLLLAVAAVVVALRLVAFQAEPGHAYFVQAKLGFNVAYASTMWTLVTLTLGLFQRFASRPCAPVRRLAEASYWMYLVHLPVIVWLQIAVAEVSLPGAVKLVGIVAATVAVSLVTYRFLVRSTPIGWVLRGGRSGR